MLIEQINDEKINDDIGPIFTIFSPRESALDADGGPLPYFPICQGTLPCNQIMLPDEGKLPSFFRLLIQSTKRNCTRRTTIAEATRYNNPYLHTIA